MTGRDQSPVNEAKNECSEFHFPSSRGSTDVLMNLPEKGEYLVGKDWFCLKNKTNQNQKNKNQVYCDIMKNGMSPFSMALTSPFVETMTLELLREETLTLS